jgi:hypothetical protein
MDSTRAPRSVGGLFCFALLFSQSAAGCGDKVAEGLAVSLAASKAEVRVGDSVEFDVRIKNVSSYPVAAPPRRRPYATGNISVYGRDGARLKSYATKFIDFAPETARDVEPLAAGDTRTIPFRAKVIASTVYDVDGDRRVNGMFLDFDGSAIELPGPGKYRVQVVFARSAELAKELEGQFRIKNAWQGEVVSESIVLTVAE